MNLTYTCIFIRIQPMKIEITINKQSLLNEIDIGFQHVVSRFYWNQLEIEIFKGPHFTYNQLLLEKFIETINEIIKADYLLTDLMQYQMAQVACLLSPAACSSLTKLTETLKSIY